MKLRVMPVFFMTDREKAEAIRGTIKDLMPKHTELTTTPYVLRVYHGRKMGVTAASTPDLERDVTVARFDANLREFVFVRGELIGYGEDYCRSNLRIKLDDVRGFMDQMQGNHHLVAYGDHGARIVDFCNQFGIAPVSPGAALR